MKRLFSLILTAALVLPAVSLSAAVVEEIVIKVNDSIVTRSEFERRLNSTLEGIKREYKGPDLEERLKEVPQRLLEQVEDELLLIEKAKQMYQVDAIVDNQIDNFMKENKLATKDDLAKALRAEGMTMDEFRKQVTLIYVPEFMKSREIRSRISISTGEIKTYYEGHKNDLAGSSKVQLQEILLLKSHYSQQQAQEAAARVKAELAAGKSFGDLASQYSEAFSKNSKGEAGWYAASDLAPAISKAVFSLGVGQVTDLLATDAGWYLFRVQAVSQAKVPTLEESRDAIVEALKEQKFQKEYTKYIDELKAQNYVRINPKYV
jgi:peptidyl-prolyl cis-trans isomerase SurA